MTRPAWPPGSLGQSKVRSAQAAWYKPVASNRSRRDYRGGSAQEDTPRLRRGSPSTGVQRDKLSLVAARRWSFGQGRDGWRESTYRARERGEAGGGGKGRGRNMRYAKGEAKGGRDSGRPSYPGPMPAGGGAALSGNRRLPFVGSPAEVHGRVRTSRRCATATSSNRRPRYLGGCESAVVGTAEDTATATREQTTYDHLNLRRPQPSVQAGHHED